jgi:hypothetical protein
VETRQTSAGKVGCKLGKGMVSMRISYELTDYGNLGRLLEPLEFITPIQLYSAKIPFGELEINGRLTLKPGYIWDFGSGPAVDTPAMVIASAAHDAFCLMTDQKLIPWECRAMADKYFRELLKEGGTSFMRRWWCYAGVRSYSTLVARWK